MDLTSLNKNDPKKEYIQGDLFGDTVVGDARLNLNKSKSFYQRIDSSAELKYFTEKLLKQKIPLQY